MAIGKSGRGRKGRGRRGEGIGGRKNNKEEGKYGAWMDKGEEEEEEEKRWVIGPRLHPPNQKKKS